MLLILLHSFQLIAYVGYVPLNPPQRQQINLNIDELTPGLCSFAITCSIANAQLLHRGCELVQVGHNWWLTVRECLLMYLRYSLLDSTAAMGNG